MIHIRYKHRLFLKTECRAIEQRCYIAIDNRWREMLTVAGFYAKTHLCCIRTSYDSTSSVTIMKFDKHQLKLADI